MANEAKGKTWNGVHHANYSKGNADVDYCVRCGKRVKVDEESVSLELNSHTNEWRDGGMTQFPAAESQGWFMFGTTCARRTLKEQHDRKMDAMRTRRGAPVAGYSEDPAIADFQKLYPRYVYRSHKGRVSMLWREAAIDMAKDRAKLVMMLQSVIDMYAPTPSQAVAAKALLREMGVKS